MIAGVLRGAPEVRHSPAGVPITRFVLEHRSRQTEADRPREVVCEVQVVASGAGLQPQLQGLVAGSTVQVKGFLARAGHRFGAHRLVLHAQVIETL